ncbi:MAG: pca operon transcription factor PcaQ [Burkholderiaceae bacterium]
MEARVSADGRIKLRHLSCFLAVMRHRSILKAAESLSVTQPAVSKTLRELEQILGLRLFERGRRGAVPTRQATLFERHAAASLNALREGVAALATPAGAAHPPLRLAALPTVAPGFVARAILELRELSPGLSLRVATGANQWLLRQLVDGEADLVVGRLSDPAQMVGLVFEHLYGEPLVLAVRPGHPLLTQRAPVEQLDSQTLVLPGAGTMIRQAADSFMSTHGLAPRGDAIETLSVSLGRALVCDSDAVWFVPLDAVAADLQAGTLARLPVRTAGSEEPVGLILRSGQAPLPGLDELIAVMRRLAASRRAAIRRDALDG